MASSAFSTQNTLLLENLKTFYGNDPSKLDTMLSIINGESPVSLRIVDWFATNYAKQKFTVYPLKDGTRFKVYFDYKLKLKAYSKRRFDPFCRWERIAIPYKGNTAIQTTLGQLNFFKWAIENDVIKYIQEHYEEIEQDMNHRNSTSRRKQQQQSDTKTRKKREELSILASKSIKQETVEIMVRFD